jgi:hypothetical protein
MPRYAKKKQKTLCHGKSQEWRKISVLRSFRALIRVLFICHGNSAQTVPEALKIRHFSQWWIDFTTFLQL